MGSNATENKVESANQEAKPTTIQDTEVNKTTGSATTEATRDLPKPKPLEKAESDNSNPSSSTESFELVNENTVSENGKQSRQEESARKKPKETQLAPSESSNVVGENNDDDNGKMARKSSIEGKQDGIAAGNGVVEQPEANENKNNEVEVVKRSIFSMMGDTIGSLLKKDEGHVATAKDDPPDQNEGEAKGDGKKKPNFFERAMDAARELKEKIGDSGQAFLKEKQEKINEVLDRAKNAMEEVEAQQNAGTYEPTKQNLKQSASTHGANSSSTEGKKSGRMARTNEGKGIGYSLGSTLAVVEVRVLQGRGILGSRSPFVVVDVEGTSKRSKEAKSGGDNPSWSSEENVALNFSISDVTGDIQFSLCDSAKIGRAIFPIKWLQASGITGGWKNFNGWLKVFPLPPDATLASATINQMGGWNPDKTPDHKYKHGLPKDEDSCMTPAPDLGAIKVSISVAPAVLMASRSICLAKSYLSPPINGMQPLIDFRALKEDIDDILEDQTRDTETLSLEGVMRILFRIKEFFGKPHILYPPYSLGTSVWLFWLSFYSRRSSLPWMIWVLLLMQGAAMWWTRSMKETVVFKGDRCSSGDDNDSKVGGEKKHLTMFQKMGMVRKILRMLGVVQAKVEQWLSIAERAKHTLSFADSTASAIFFALLGVVCFVAQILIRLLPAGLPLFLLGVGILLPPWIKMYKMMKVQRARKESGSAKEGKNKDWLDLLLDRMLRIFENFLNHVPDYNELAHRHICKRQLDVEEEKKEERKTDNA